MIFKQQRQQHFNINIITVVLSISIIAIVVFGHSQPLLSTREEFIEKIDGYLDNESLFDDLLKNHHYYSTANRHVIEEYYRGAFKRIRNRLSIPSHRISFDPPTYNQTVIDAFASKILLNPQQNLTWNPYDIVGFNTTLNDSVCAVLYPNDSDRSTYYLVNYTSADAAIEAGAFVTHLHDCGYCSTTKDLASYMSHPDLTDPIRDCAIVSFVSDKDSLECIQHSANLTYNCAVIWLYDALNTRKDCLDICLIDWIMHTPNNVPPNSTTLNKCLQCDEDMSGPVFKVVAARTRRDSGLESAINRPPDSIYNITHYYY
ncbi:hypothetical protein DFA_09660 [Cavenderia fasciculata]|uniref:Uncharacterized protein n=1 Tax=Cavenderia fasciculata TaxID=261658 RepID=F4Q888_CACFS|nr:uncharacterized protein DFA_09660 [Cavenderia fasciculata]EGG15988.1 hypothetical protein DFA_09660 [Cavenderia fasciculata]|eukprot:XP_004352313.1 hypothetical protein DFA_09660 [Cavenderia fasciculata]